MSTAMNARSTSRNMMPKRHFVALLCLVFFVEAAIPAKPRSFADDALFPFVVSYDNPTNLTNLAGWLDKPAGGHGFVRADNGHLATDAGPIRFWGTNLCFEACFPSHEQAERLAGRLARLGINVVRLHHMDSRAIWGDSPDKLTIDPKQLERLDYLIWQLKRQGIYTNLNLHVSRSLGPAEGFPGDPQLRPKYDKGLDNFEPRMIEFQRRYARDLLTHQNPYTATSYAREPAIAFVEINNENALFDQWHRGQLDLLPLPYSATFRRLWNDWLRKKYATTQRLEAAWRAGQQPLGTEMLKNGDFAGPLEEAWSLERDDQTDVAWSVEPAGAESRRCLRLVVRHQGRESWRPQFSQRGLAVKKGEAYTLTFFARADRPQRIGANCMMAHEPWQRLGLSSSANLTADWQRQRFTFVAEADDDNARITVTNLRPATYEFAALSLRPGGIDGLPQGQQIEDISVAVVEHDNNGRTPAVRRDFIDFLWDTEREYWTGMHQFLKQELGVHALVSGTQLGYSPVHIQSKLDYIDAHAYWQHPRFPGRPWDPNNWYVVDEPMVNAAGGTLTSLAGRRVAGMPFTVSEYNHPYPNSYAAEGLPMLAAMAAHQAWDGVYSFTYSHNTEFQPDRLTGYFDIKADPAKLVHMPACVAMFVRGDLAAAKETISVPLSETSERSRLYESGDPWSSAIDRLGLDYGFFIWNAVEMALNDKRPTAQVVGNLNDLQLNWPLGAERLRWYAAPEGQRYFAVDTPRTKLFTGFVAGRAFQLGDVTLCIDATKLDWATVTLTCVDGKSFSQPGRVLIAASGWQQNTGAEVQQLGDRRITLGSRWGEGPVLCEGIPAEISLPVAANRVTFYALDEAGNRREQLTCQPDGGKTAIRIDPRHKTLWYEVAIAN